MSNLNNINQLKAALGNPAKPSKFTIDLPIPSAIKGVSSVNNLLNKIPLINKVLSFTGNEGEGLKSTSVIKLLAKSTSLPSKSVGTITMWDRGHKYIVRDVAQFSHSWTCTFYSTSGHELRKVFEQWMYEMDRFDHVKGEPGTSRTIFMTNNMGVGTPKALASLNPGYMVDVDVSQLGCNGSKTAEFTLHGAFPTDLSEITLDATQMNVISEFSVTFAFSNWTRNEGVGGAVVGGVLNEIGRGVGIL